MKIATYFLPLFVGLNLCAQQNTILIIADDVSPDYFGCFSPATDTANTPNIRLLAENGVKFTKAWATPVCSPTRVSIMTGKYPFRTGVGEVVTGPPSAQISLSEVGVANLLRDLGPVEYNTACIGKWHINNNSPTKYGYPNSLGFNFYSGNFNGAISDYYNYQRIMNGVVDTVTEYATTQTIDDAIGWMDTMNAANPFFLWLAFNAPHDPYHLPPANLCNTAGLPGTAGHIAANKDKYFKASIEAMDTEMGRLFTYLSANNLLDSTNIIFIGDNGNSNQISQLTTTLFRAKGTIYNYGVHVPVIVSGPAVVNVNRSSDALINVADLYGTIAELSGFGNWQAAIPIGDVVDSKSFLPILKDQTMIERSWIFTEAFKAPANANDGKTMRNEDYQLIRFDAGQEEFYNVTLDPEETNDLLVSPNTMTNTDWDNYMFLCDSLGALTGTTGCPFLELNTLEEQVYIVSPNPFHSELRLEGNFVLEEIRVLNILGKDITHTLEYEKQDEAIIIHAESLTPGTYFIRSLIGTHKIICQ